MITTTISSAKRIYRKPIAVKGIPDKISFDDAAITLGGGQCQAKSMLGSVISRKGKIIGDYFATFNGSGDVDLSIEFF